MSSPLRFALLIDHLVGDYEEAIRKSVVSASRDAGAHLISVMGRSLQHPDPRQAAQNQVYELISRHNCDGVIALSGPLELYSGPVPMAELCRRFLPLPVCSIGSELPGIPSLLVDNQSGVFAATEHMIERHHEREVGFIRGPAANAEANERYAAYRAALHKHGIAFNPELVYEGDFQIRSGIEAVEAFLDQRALLPRAIVTANDNMALGAIEALERRNLHVPYDVRVIGFDNLPLARFASSPLTTAGQPFEQLGQRAVESLLLQRAGATVPLRQVLPVDFVVRHSCGCGYELPSAPPLTHAAGAELAAKLLERRADLLDRMHTSVAGSPVPGPPSWGAKLLDALITELQTHKPAFVRALEDALKAAQREGETLDVFQLPLAVLQASVSTSEPATARVLDQLWHRASLILSGTSTLIEGRRRLSAEWTARHLLYCGDKLSTSTTTKDVEAALAEQLPKLDVATLLYCRYTDAHRRELEVQFAYQDFHPIAPMRRNLTTSELWPDELALATEPQEYLLAPLSFDQHQLGLIYFQLGDAAPLSIEGLRDQLSFALHAIDRQDQIASEIRRREEADRQRLEKELEIAREIQSGLLPRAFRVEGFDIHARMKACEEIGGDYYDILPVQGGCWLGIGDISGSGLHAGLMMLMIQSTVSALIHASPFTSPKELIARVNDVIYRNVHGRLGRTEFATMTLLRCRATGEVQFAGAHQDLIIWRAATRQCETLPTPGVWISSVPNIRGMTEEVSLQLEDGDLLVLYTDGVTDALDSQEEPFGLARLCLAIERCAGEDVATIATLLLAEVGRFSSERRDDQTLVVVRFHAADTYMAPPSRTISAK